MINRNWLLIFINVLLITSLRADDDGFEDEEEEVHVPVEDEKEQFIPSVFVAPTLGESSKANFFDYFPVGSKIGQKWVKSLAKKDGDFAYSGEWAIETPTKVAIEGDYGLVVKSKARHHAISAKLDTPFKFDSENFVVQYDVKFQEGQECGGGYLKLLSAGAEKDLANFADKTPYTVMFGPDKCGASGQIHLIFRYKNPKNGTVSEHHAKAATGLGTTYWDDHNTHVYTLVVKPTGEYSVNVDGKSVTYGHMMTDLNPPLTPPKMISDETDIKPTEWDDREEVEDESVVKPEDWDETEPQSVVDEDAVKPYDWNEDENELIPDPEASKPADWDNDMDGEWEAPRIDNPICKTISGCGKWKAPTIKNPKYKGKWIRPRIKNPAYKGKWAARLIDNPDYFEPTPFGGLAPVSAVGIELWTMSEDILIDNVLITSSEAEAADVAKQTFGVKVAEEYRLAAASGEGGGLIKSIIDAANEKPWLWAVYVLCVVLPLVLIGVFCFGRQSKPKPTNYAKKTDAYSQDDDKIPNLIDDAEAVEEEEEEEEDEEDLNQPGPSNTKAAVVEDDEDEKQQPSTSKTDSSAASSAAEEEDEGKHTVEENEPVQPTEEVAKSPKQSGGGAKRRTARRGD